MKILSMTATFGKLENQTLPLESGLNIIEAPNEWGKSTWCAFLTAMLYGIETRVHSTKTAIADKERYAPWSGAPMAGRMDILWNGRAITIERSTKGRSIFGVFKAYETDTGLEIPELTAANCGQMLLGVEKSVFQRVGFLKLSDLPVTQDEALRRRLNAIVTTGDESGTADALGQTLRDLKNRCRANRSNGLLPQAETQRKEIRDKLEELEALHGQVTQYSGRLEQLARWNRELENHKIALEYAANATYNQKLSAAEAALEAANAKEAALKNQCAALPSLEEADGKLLQLRQLRQHWDSLHMEAQLLPQSPQMPDTPAVFRDQEPDAAVMQARADQEHYTSLTKQRPFPWYWILVMALAIPTLLIPHWAGIALAAVLAGSGGVLLGMHIAGNSRQKAAAQQLLQRYGTLPPQDWVASAQRYADARAAYSAAMVQFRQTRQQLEQRRSDLAAQIAAVTGGTSLAEAEHTYINAQQQLQALSAAVREHRRAEELVQALRSTHRETPAPAFPDRLAYTLQETARLLSDCAGEQRQIQQKLDITRGRIESLGDPSALDKALDAVNQRISALETTYAALELAQNTLADATAQLQRRFAPQIANRAQALFGKLTGGRYNRLTLSEDLSANAATGDETTLRSALWRSDGTTDQLYLALRLAMAEALTPEAPLVLDDALVRFDDTRLASALTVLSETAKEKQVILFTCQSREAEILNQEVTQ